jgi:hypothetical protein
MHQFNHSLLATLAQITATLDKRVTLRSAHLTTLKKE